MRSTWRMYSLDWDWLCRVLVMQQAKSPCVKCDVPNVDKKWEVIEKHFSKSLRSKLILASKWSEEHTSVCPWSYFLNWVSVSFAVVVCGCSLLLYLFYVFISAEVLLRRLTEWLWQTWHLIRINTGEIKK